MSKPVSTTEREDEIRETEFLISLNSTIPDDLRNDEAIAKLKTKLAKMRREQKESRS